MNSTNISCDFQANYSCWRNLVEQLNGEWVRVMIPVEIMMFIFMIVGFLGNILVIIVYSYRPKKTTANIFIMFLASIDLFACAVLHPYIIYKQFHNYDQVWDKTCKLFEYLVHCILSLSGLTLLLVAVDRYLAICQPVKFLLFYKHVEKAIAAVTLVSVIASLPLLEFYGATPYEVVEFKTNFTGYKCHYKIPYQKSPELTAFGGFIMCGFLSEIIAMLTLYKSVAVTAFRRRRAVRPLSNAHILAGIKPSVSGSGISKEAPRNKLNGQCSGQNHLKNVISLQEISHFSEGISGLATLSSGNDCDQRLKIVLKSRQTLDVPSTNCQDSSQSQNISVRLKAAKVLFSVTAVFFLSWMPFLIMRTCEAINSNYWTDTSITRYTIENLLYHVFYLNNAVNPIIYTIINKNFRADCRTVLRKRFRSIRH